MRFVGWVLVGLLWLFIGVACTVPQWRIAQKKVPSPIPSVSEAEKRGAYLVAEMVTAPAAIIPLAKELSVSLGEPINRETTEAGIPSAIAGLKKGTKEKKRLEIKRDAFLSKYQGYELEGTGLNLFGPVSIGLVFALVAAPGALSVCFVVIRRLRATIQTISEGVENFKASNPDKVEDLEYELGRTMDSPHKKIVRREKNVVKARNRKCKISSEKLSTV